MTSRELVYQTLAFENAGRAPRQVWLLPWASQNHPAETAYLAQEYENDIVTANGHWAAFPPTVGDPYEPGEARDEWGCHFVNIQRGLYGEVRKPLIADDDWADAANVRFPEEWLTINPEKINLDCKNSDKFIHAGCNPRPFERLQFLRTSELLYMDIADPPKKMMAFIEKLHDFYCRLVTAWAQTDVDAISFMDDWGSQTSLLINPKTWAEIFKPLYKDYIDIAHKHGKKAFMHSDGNTLAILPHLIELGLDAFNTQLFCMDMEQLARYKGQITFWGEIDRQYLLPFGTVDEVRQAVRTVHSHLWQNGGCIAQCEFGAGGKPENVLAVFDEWNKLTGAEML